MKVQAQVVDRKKDFADLESAAALIGRQNLRGRLIYYRFRGRFEIQNQRDTTFPVAPPQRSLRRSVEELYSVVMVHFFTEANFISLP